ncbi:MAG TPA: hypothetical protein VHW23_32640 [Kofleriaceae bacterium]|jgi:hypothetical protein|nr:hypothetical protein [Kofleriaceae bacterium]
MAARAAVVVVIAAVAACGGGGGAPAAVAPAAPLPAGTERLLAMLPQGAQIIVEVDLARLRGNPVIGAAVTRALTEPPAPAAATTPAAVWLRGVLRGRPSDDAPAAAAPSSPLAVADQVVLAAYGVGTADAATLTLLAAPREVPGATRIADGAYAVGPPEWVEQVEQRVALATTGEARFAIRPAPELLELRAHAMPAAAPGASLRITARLSFDARIALARQTGIDTPPAQLSAWGDVVDDLALVIDCDAADPGSAPAGRSTGGPAGGRRSDPTHRLAGALRAMLATLAELPAVRALGLPPSLTGARLIARGTWVRAIIAVGPEHLRRIAARAAGLLDPAPAAPSAPAAPPDAVPASPDSRGAPPS